MTGGFSEGPSRLFLHCSSVSGWAPLPAKEAVASAAAEPILCRLADDSPAPGAQPLMQEIHPSSLQILADIEMMDWFI